MENILSLLNLFNQTNKEIEPPTQPIPKEILDQYPYGQFPERYTKHGQENIRIQSEKRFSYEEENNTIPTETKQDLNISSFLPLIQLISSSNKKQPKEMMQLLSKLIFKDNRDMQKIFDLFPIKSQEFKKDDFPNTNNISIATLKRVN